MDQPDDIVTRLLNSDGRVNELLKEAAQYITTLRQSLVVLNNQLSKETNHEETSPIAGYSTESIPHLSGLRQSLDAA